MDTQLAKSIGAAARRARKALELTQEDAAERIGVSVEFYARIERGNSLPSVPTFVRIANSLGVSADSLIGRNVAPETESAAWQPAPPPSESPEIRRLLRLLRRASPATMRLVTLLVKEMEKHGRSDGDTEPSDEGPES
jgi:transcriptional regulator with XRE-family HTH domain